MCYHSGTCSSRASGFETSAPLLSLLLMDKILLARGVFLSTVGIGRHELTEETIIQIPSIEALLYIDKTGASIIINTMVLNSLCNSSIAPMVPKISSHPIYRSNIASGPSGTPCLAGPSRTRRANEKELTLDPKP